MPQETLVGACCEHRRYGRCSPQRFPINRFRRHCGEGGARKSGRLSIVDRELEHGRCSRQQDSHEALSEGIDRHRHVQPLPRKHPRDYRWENLEGHLVAVEPTAMWRVRRAAERHDPVHDQRERSVIHWVLQLDREQHSEGAVERGAGSILRRLPPSRPAWFSYSSA